MKRRIMRIALGLLAVLGLLVAVLLVRAALFTSVQREVPPSTLEVDSAAVAQRLGEAIRIATISRAEQIEAAPFHAFHRWLEATYPRFHAVAEVETFAELTRVYTWKGRDPALPPVAFMAHQDVVPVEAGTEKDWTHPPFSGAIAPCGDEPGDCVWGRGAIDMKATLISLFETAERLSASGWAPKRTIYFIFGHDEEVGGAGAQAVAKAFTERGIKLTWLLDEGLLVTDGIMKGLEPQGALIGLAEKGYVSVEVIARDEGGHSSMPPKSTAVGRLSRAIARLEADPFPADIDGAVAAMFERLGPEMSFGNRLVLANMWLLEGALIAALDQSPTTATMLRTTQAPTMLRGSMQDNVLPQAATAVINYRIHPRDSVASVLARMKEVIDDPQVELKPLEGNTLFSEPSPVASVESAGYGIIEGSVRAAFPEAAVAGGLFIAATDSRYFRDVADDVYKFHPIVMNERDRPRIHGTDERLRVSNLVAALRFFDGVIRGAGE